MVRSIMQFASVTDIGSKFLSLFSDMCWLQPLDTYNVYYNMYFLVLNLNVICVSDHIGGFWKFTASDFFMD